MKTPMNEPEDQLKASEKDSKEVEVSQDQHFLSALPTQTQIEKEFVRDWLNSFIITWYND
jgi:hypothetical protein